MQSENDPRTKRACELLARRDMEAVARSSAVAEINASCADGAMTFENVVFSNARLAAGRGIDRAYFLEAPGASRFVNFRFYSNSGQIRLLQ